MQIFATRSFRWWEMSLVKICLISLGLLLGIYYPEFIIGLKPLWWILFGVTAAYFFAKFFRGEA